MSTSNSSSAGQNAFDPRTAAELREKRKATIQKTLATRHRKEKTFRIFGFSSVMIGLAFVALLFSSILYKGLPAFWQASISVPVYFDPKIIDVGPKPVQTKDESPAQYQERYIDWQTKIGMVDWDSMIVNAMIAKDPALAKIVKSLVASTPVLKRIAYVTCYSMILHCWVKRLMLSS